MAVEGLHALYDDVDVIGAVGMIHLADEVDVNGVELQDVVVHPHQGVVYGLTVNHRRVAQHGDLGLGTVLVAQADGVVDDFGEVGVARRFAVAGEGQHIGHLAVFLHLL